LVTLKIPGKTIIIMHISRILIAPDSFKESLSSVRVAECLRAGLQLSSPETQVDLAPLSDGGEGFVEAMVSATGGKIKVCRVNDALMRPVGAEMGFSPDGQTAFIEMASASGLEKIPPEERNPMVTSTFGTGELILAAMAEGCKKIIIGIGGSATNDGGAGMARALGVRLPDRNGADLGPGGGELSKLRTIDFSGIIREIPEILVACDVSNPLTGPDGASAVFGPQKGATVEMIGILDRNLKHFARIIREQTGHDVENVPGAGAAGGLGAGLMAFTGAKLMNGFRVVAETLELEKRIAAADMVITGEGRLDSQTLSGKAPFGVAQLGSKYNLPVIGVAGTFGEGWEELYRHGFSLLLSIVNKTMTLEEAMRNAPELIKGTGVQIGKILKLCDPLC
jgi:glycerate 2-kinase